MLVQPGHHAVVDIFSGDIQGFISPLQQLLELLVPFLVLRGNSVIFFVFFESKIHIFELDVDAVRDVLNSIRLALLAFGEE